MPYYEPPQDLRQENSRVQWEALYLADRILVLSNCPATVKREYIIDLPRPRSYVAPEFLALRKEITGIMDSTL